MDDIMNKWNLIINLKLILLYLCYMEYNLEHTKSSLFIMMQKLYRLQIVQIIVCIPWHSNWCQFH